MFESKNVLGGKLKVCSCEPLTGFYRDSYCNTGYEDRGMHTVCCRASSKFLEFSKASGNDLSTPVPQYGFPGVKADDKWCLCAGRWLEAYKAGAAPLVDLEATHEETLVIIPLEVLQKFKLD